MIGKVSGLFHDLLVSLFSLLDHDFLDVLGEVLAELRSLSFLHDFKGLTVVVHSVLELGLDESVDLSWRYGILSGFLLGRFLVVYLVHNLRYDLSECLYLF